MEHSFELRLIGKEETIDRVMIPLTTKELAHRWAAPATSRSYLSPNKSRYECLSKSMNADQVLAAGGRPALAS
jgi:hypothetical protein